MIIKLEQFAPDADFSEPGIIVDCNSLVPSVRGYKAAPTPTDPGFDAISGTVLGAAVLRKLDNTTRYVAGTGTSLYLLNGSSWDDVTRTVGGAYSATTDLPWDFAQFGNVTIAANKSDTLQYLASGTDFADISGAPKAKLVETVNQFVFLADTNDGVFGDSPDRWWCSAIGDYTDWTPDVDTQCVSGRLTSAPGRINALKRLGDAVVAYKDRAIFVGSYVGAPEAWVFQEIPGEVGCMGAQCVVDLGSSHVFLGYDNFWQFDGSRPVPIGNPVKDWFFSNLFTDYGYRIKAIHDRNNSNVYWFYPSTAGAGVLDSGIVYNYRSNRWGIADQNVEAIVDYVSAGLTWASTFASTYTFGSIESTLTWDSPLLVAGQPAPAFIGTDHKTYLLTGAGDTWNFTTNDFGDDSAVITVTRVKPRFLTAPATSTLTNYYRMVMGDAVTEDTTSTYGSGRYDFLRSARWHRFHVAGTGGGEIVGLDVQATGAGNE